jgi:hypothetical protein
MIGSKASGGGGGGGSGASVGVGGESSEASASYRASTIAGAPSRQNRSSSSDGGLVALRSPVSSQRCVVASQCISVHCGLFAPTHAIRSPHMRMSTHTHSSAHGHTLTCRTASDRIMAPMTGQPTAPYLIVQVDGWCGRAAKGAARAAAFGP